MSIFKCFICDGVMQHSFTKDSYPQYNELCSIEKILPALFYRCPECGFVASKTHTELKQHDWHDLNYEFHHQLESCVTEQKHNQPPYAEQAMMIALLAEHRIIDDSNILDYAAGYGSLSKIAKKYFHKHIKCYEKYITSPDAQYVTAPFKKSYSMVINSAMFEHMTSRQDIEEVFDLVSSEGCLFIHTLVPENVPDAPDWFYLNIPVHTVTHTNKSMAILMQQWGFKSSIYSPYSKSWVLLRKDYNEIQPIITRINQELQKEWLYVKNGFMDYWK